MPSQAELDLSIVRVLDTQGAVAGTGFALDDRLVVTCAHVIGERAEVSARQVRVIFQAGNEERLAEILHESWQGSPGDDLALLRVEGALPAAARVAILGASDQSQGHAFRTFGYPRLQATGQGAEPFKGVWAEGTITGSVLRATGERALQLSSADIAPGTSGGPVFDLVTGRVVGIVTDVYLADRSSKHLFTAWATPAEAIPAIYPDVVLQPGLDAQRIRQRLILVTAGAVILIGLLIALLWTMLPPGRLPEISAFTHPALEKSDLNAIAAFSGTIWFATSNGLVRHSALSGQTETVPGITLPVQSVAAEPGGKAVWFGLADGRVGRLTTGDQRVEYFDPMVDGQHLSSEVLAILPEYDGTVWFGDKLFGVFRLTPDRRWERVAPPVPPPTLSRVEALAENRQPPRSLWVVGGTLVFRRTDGLWDYFDSLNTNGQLPSEVINAIAIDAYGRVWFAHPQGISVLVKGSEDRDRRNHVWRNCTASASGERLPLGVALSLAVSDNGHAIWVATERGLARIDVGEEDLPEDCSKWVWHTWPATAALSDFWARNGEIRIAADDVADNDQAVIWLIKRRSDRVLRLNWP